jgi:hypothetical protein
MNKKPIPGNLVNSIARKIQPYNIHNSVEEKLSINLSLDQLLMPYHIIEITILS